MNLVFFGTDIYSVTVLDTLRRIRPDDKYSVVTTRPLPKGKNRIVGPNEVEKYAGAHDLKIVYYPDNTGELINFVRDLKEVNPDAGISASFGRIIKNEIITVFGNTGIINLHPSLLPQYRNVAPVPYAIAMGDSETGITLFRIGSGIDNGEILAQVAEPILTEDTSPVLLHRLFTLGAGRIPDILSGSVGNPAKVPQTAPLIFTHRLSRESGFVEWGNVLKMIKGGTIAAQDTANPLIQMRLTHHPERAKNILVDLIRALEGWEKVWTVAELKKGKIETSLGYDIQSKEFSIHLAGKPKPITVTDFEKYYPFA